jgi:hypothetical protein
MGTIIENRLNFDYNIRENAVLSCRRRWFWDQHTSWERRVSKPAFRMSSDVHFYMIIRKLLDFLFQHTIGTNITIPEISSNTKKFSSKWSYTEAVTYPQKYIRQNLLIIIISSSLLPTRCWRCPNLLFQKSYSCCSLAPPAVGWILFTSRFKDFHHPRPVFGEYDHDSRS